MRLRQIEVFQAILQVGTISGAARLLNVSQPNVSRILTHTEQQLGFPLFIRQPKGLKVSEEGKQLIPKVESLYHELQSITALTENMKKHQSRDSALHIGAAHACAQQLVAPVMVEFQQTAQHVPIELVTEHFSTLRDAVLDNKLEFALTFGQHVPSELLAEPIFQSRMVAILPKELAHPDSVSLAWLYQHNLLMMQPDDPLGRVVHKAMAFQQLNPTNLIYVKTYSMIADLIVSGGGVGIVDLFTAARYKEQLDIVPIIEPLPFELMLISRRESPQSHAALELKKMFKRRCIELSNE